MIKSYLLHKKKIQNRLENRRTLPDLIPLPTTHNKARPTHLLDGLCSAILALERTDGYNSVPFTTTLPVLVRPASSTVPSLKPTNVLILSVLGAFVMVIVPLFDNFFATDDAP